MRIIENLKILHFVVLFTFLFSVHGQSQQLGMSFSFFFPRDGYFSNPVSPFSFRGVGINPSRYFALETGITLYRMSGMNIRDLPFQSNEPLMGPLFSVFVPAEAVLKIPFDNFTFRLKGGGFVFYNFGNRINYGNMDRAIASYQGWDVANSSLEFENKIGVGWLAGTELIVNITKQFGMNFEVNYISGGSPLNIQGTYTGGTYLGGLETLPADFKQARLDFTGWEITIGVLFNTR